MSYSVVSVGDLPWPWNPFRCALVEQFRAENDLETFDERARSELFGRFVESRSDQLGECPYHQSDWKSAAEQSVEVHRKHSPVDARQAERFLRESGGSEEDLELASSFWWDPILWRPGLPVVTDGQHRTCALKMSGAAEVLVAY